ncbi:thiamine pyrophosphate-binding protein [Chitinophaga qingshengii]|uniref:Thiamine pyrophosphate-binding protein n=1 Tax=Chitinophaga qingshengii TaxID=1569794 RepID=A0ABR7TIM3_9BACT|nr:thiamine pyrophosphate-binding protein [Chitinophaga qingshengii]MBC9929808.1 thiamine pyrophosphate-binding protein [Chitinophaga qingshengii]
MAKTPANVQRWTRDYVFDILKDLGIHYIFGVPGTNEIPIIDGTSYEANGVRYIECLHENIAIGAAMGSARMTGKPGVLVVHVTPGIAHSIGNLFNAYRSEMPLVILCCQQQNELVTQEPLLASNLVELAREYTKWAHEVRTPAEIPLVLQRAFKEAMAPPNGPVFVSIPWDFTMVAIKDTDKVKGVTRISPHFTGDEASIRQAADLLAACKSPVIVAGDAVGYADAWEEMKELAALIGAPVVLQTFSSVANFPNDDYHWQGELPGTQGGIQDVFKKHDLAFLIGFGAQAQLAVFKYADGPLFPEHLKQIYLTNNTWDIGKNYYGEAAIFGDIKTTLPILNKYIKAKPPQGAAARNEQMRALDAERTEKWNNYLQMAMGEKKIWSVVIAKALKDAIERRGLTDKYVYVHEAVSDSAPFQYYLPFGPKGSKPISYYCVAGGSLGWSMPASIGIKLEQQTVQGITPQLVINAVGDGSALFYPQTWWTAAHEKLPILYIITNNHEYHTLQVGLQQVVSAYGEAPGYQWHPKTMDPSYLRLEAPVIDYVSLAKAFGGQTGELVRKPGDVMDAIEKAIEHVLAQKTSYILDMRIAQDTPATPTDTSKIARDAVINQHYFMQPPLDVFHSDGVAALAKSAAGSKNGNGHVPVNMPALF